MRCGPVVATALLLVHGACMDCTIEAYVDQFFDEHDAFECRFAYRYHGLTELVGAEAVRGCILDALENRTAFVGGYLIAGIDSHSIDAFLGTADGDVELIHEYTFNARRLSISSCAELRETGVTPDGIGLECIGKNLEPLCDQE